MTKEVFCDVCGKSTKYSGGIDFQSWKYDLTLRDICGDCKRAIAIKIKELMDEKKQVEV